MSKQTRNLQQTPTAAVRSTQPQLARGSSLPPPSLFPSGDGAVSSEPVVDRNEQLLAEARSLRLLADTYIIAEGRVLLRSSK
jgi:hypothetical protein